MGGIVAVVAAQRARATRELVEHLRQQKAFSADKPALLRPQRRMGKQALLALVREGAVIKVGEETYWLDETAYAALRARRRLLMLWMLVSGAVAVAAVIYLTVTATGR